MTIQQRTGQVPARSQPQASRPMPEVAGVAHRYVNTGVWACMSPRQAAGRRCCCCRALTGFRYCPGASFFACSPSAARRARASASAFTGCNCNRSILLRA